MILVPLTVAQARAIVAGDLAGIDAGRGWPHADTYDALRPFATFGSDEVPGPFLVVVDGEVIGDCGWYGPPGTDGEVEIGYGLAAPFRGRGLGTAMVKLLAAWARAQPGVRKVVALTDVDNVASRRALERAGFVVDAPGERTVRYAICLDDPT